MLLRLRAVEAVGVVEEVKGIERVWEGAGVVEWTQGGKGLAIVGVVALTRPSPPAAAAMARGIVMVMIMVVVIVVVVGVCLGTLEGREADAELQRGLRMVSEGSATQTDR